MSDHAKTVARLCAPMPAEAYEALDALVAELAEADEREKVNARSFLAQVDLRKAAEKERDAALGIETEVILDDLRATEKLATDERERRIAAEAEVARLREALRDVPEAMDSCVEYMEAAERDGLEPWSVAATTVKAHCSVTAEDVRAALAAPTKDR